MPKLTMFDKMLQRTLLPFIPRSMSPNQMTMVRFVLTPFVVWLLLVHEYAWAFPLFLLASLTDALDGAMARTRDQITDVGKIIDPAADKLLIGSVSLVLVWHYIGWPVVVGILLVEACSVVRGGIFLRRGVVLQANFWGKSKMIVQVAAVALILLGIMFQLSLFFTLAYILYIVSIALGILSIASYGT